MDTGNVDMAKTMAEVFSIGDINKDEKLSKVEFVQVRMIKSVTKDSDISDLNSRKKRNPLSLSSGSAVVLESKLNPSELI